MPEITRAQIDALRRSARTLLDAIEALDATPVVPPQIAALVAHRVAGRICLACGQKADDKEQMRRGQDAACYATTRNRIKRGETTEREQIEAGKLTATHATPGRAAKQDRAAAAEAYLETMREALPPPKKKKS
jgi:hypothetical protein